MDLQQAFDEGFDALKGYVDRSFDAYAKRIEALEQRFASMPAPKDGKDADPVAIASIVRDGIAGELAAIKAAVDAFPEAPELPDIAGMIAEAVSAIPEPMGADAIKTMIDEAVAALPPAEPGKDADPVEIEAAIKAEVERAVAAIEKPKDGHTPTPEEYSPMIAEAVGKAVAALPAPKDGKDGRDGLDVKDVFVDEDGNLVAVFSDGRTKSLGKFRGKDGEPGRAGKDGLDGLGFDEMDLAETDAGLVLRFMRGDQVKEFPLPVVVDRGVFKEGQTYAKGSGVTWGGSFWIAQGETGEKPDTGKGWRLAVKKGRDGKDGTVQPDNGPPKVKI